MGKRKNTPTSSDRLAKSKRMNQTLRKLVKRQRRDLVILRKLIMQAQHCANKGDNLRAIALISTKIKYPPSIHGIDDCAHVYASRYVEMCTICQEVGRHE